MISLILLLFILCLVAMLSVIFLVDDYARSLAFFLLTLSVFSGLVALALLDEQLSESDPKAIDVYRGNTELKVVDTIENGKLIKSDTIVVFKSKSQ